MSLQTSASDSPHPAARGSTPSDLRATIDLAPIGIAQFDPSGRFLLVNDRLCEILGLSRAELLERTFQEISFPDDLARCLELTRALAMGEIPSYQIEKRFVRPGGDPIWTRITTSVAREVDGHPRFFIATAEDISARVAAAEARVLGAREAQFRTLANSVPQLAWVSDGEANRSWYNDRWYDYTGESLETLAGRGWMRMHPPGVGEAVLASQLRAFNEGVAWEETVRLRAKDGSYRWFLSRAVPVKGSDGTLLHWIGTNTDVTEQRVSEDALRQREVRFRSALDIESVGVIFFDNTHRVTGVNRAFEQMSGYSADEVTGRVLWHDLTSAHGRQVAERRAAEYDASGRTTPDEQEYVRRDGARWWALVTANRVGPDEGVKFVVDITDRKRTEAELAALLAREKAARRIAEQATLQRQQVLAFVAHDLRNPVQTIVMSAGLLLDLPLNPDQRTRQAELIKRSAWSMDRLIADLLDVSQMDAGTFTVRSERLEVAPLLSEVEDIFGEQARAAGVALTCEAEPGLTSANGDRQRLVQALSNLVGNALKFTGNGGRVTVAAAREGGSMIVEVRDTGRGIVPEALPAIFERFWQADRDAGGAGLGLVITRGIVEAHGGSIEVDSVVGRGTTFRVHLPLSGTR